MKKTAKLLICALTVVISSVMTLDVFATDFDTAGFDTYYISENAPQGTVYVDILARIDTDDENYTDFNVGLNIEIGRDESGSTVMGELDITSESEIVTFDEDSYVSLSFHHKQMEHMVIEEGRIYANLNTEYDMVSACKDYKKFKAAYVDSKGNVLGVTNAVRVRPTDHTWYRFYLDGDTLKSENMIAGVNIGIVTFVIFAVPILILGILMLYLTVSVTKRKIKEKKNKQNTSSEV